MTDIIIKYQGKESKGTMTVHLEELLSCRMISKVRKLIKLIHQYGDDSDIQKILNIIEQFNETYELDQNLNSKKIVGYTDKVKFTDQQIKNLVYNRSQYKKQSSPWEYYNIQVKEQRKELRHIKACLSKATSDFKQNERLKKFYDDCKNVIQG